MNNICVRASARTARSIRAVSTRQPRIQFARAANRAFHASSAQLVVKPFLLADIGEGIREVQIIQWFVQPGARVEQFDKICEVQSDKASVEITSRFDGVIKKLHYDADDMAIVGKPLLDIDIQGDISAEDEAATTPAEEQAEVAQAAPADDPTRAAGKEQQAQPSTTEPPSKPPSGKHASLATPAVRRMTKELDVDVADIRGTGKDGRVLKEDVQKFASSRLQATKSRPAPSAEPVQDRPIALSPTQAQMFKTMTRSLSIPHFLYTDTIDVTALNALRKSHNASASQDQKLSVLPFLVKAASLAMTEFPLVNARLDTSTTPDKPQLILRGNHNIGIACDTPQGLLVPVLKSVQNLSVAEIAAEAKRLTSLARDGKLTSANMSGGTFTVSNIGNIGGGVLAPVIVDSQVAIVGVGRTKAVPAFDESENLVKREECTLSWSGDHRVLDGATLARCANLVKKFIEQPASMIVHMR